jgi:hypothetical protein
MSPKLFRLLFGLILILRISLAAGFRGNFDTQSYLLVVRSVESGQNIYAATDRYNYSPLWSWIVTGLWRAATPNVGVFVLLLGLLEVAADCVSAMLLLRIAGRRLGRSPEEARRGALLFFSNPVSILISCVHGQFDGLSILFLLAAILAASPGSPRRAPGAAAWLSLSLLVKHVTLFHPLLFSRRRSGGVLSDAMLLVPYAVFAASFLPYAAALPSIWTNVVAYGARASALQKPGGLPTLVDWSGVGGWVSTAVFLAGVLWTLRETRHLELTRASLVLFLGLLTFSPTFAVQYLVWPVALGSLFPTAAYGIYALAAALYHSSAPESLGLAWPVRTTVLGTWAAGAAWLAVELVHARRERLGPAVDFVSRA